MVVWIILLIAAVAGLPTLGPVSAVLFLVALLPAALLGGRRRQVAEA